MAHATGPRDFHGTPVEIDVGIAPLIEALWAAGIETSGSCEDWATSADDVGALPAGMAMVGFAHKDAARRFAKTCRVKAVDPTVMVSYPNAEELAQAEAQGVRFGGAVVFPAHR